jgi:hypothetical protein
MNRFRPFLITVIIFLSSYFLFSAATNETYKVKTHDTLPGIAINFYSKKPFSEKDVEQNMYRWILIFNENRERLGLKIEFRSFGWDPVVYIEPGQDILIPVMDEMYPEPVKLENMIYEEMVKTKGNLRSSLEDPDVVIYKNKRGETVREIVLSEDGSGDLAIKDIIYDRQYNKLTDNTVVPYAPDSEFEIYSYKTIQDVSADKTIFIFPDLHTDYQVGFSRYMTMSMIEELNSGKNIFVLLESTDRTSDRVLINDFYDIRKKKIEYDISKALTEPFAAFRGTDNMRPGIIPSMALFYENDNINVIGSENRSSLEDYIKSEKLISKEIEQKYFEYRKALLGEFYLYHKKETEKLILNIENSIMLASQENKINDISKIYELNRLQENFARIYLGEDFYEVSLSGLLEKNLADILISIDNLCGANTLKTFLAYREMVRTKRAELVKPGTDKDIYEHKKIIEQEIYDRFLLARDMEISETMASLPENSIGIFELGTAHINNQIRLCKEKKNYNLVIFHHPALNYELLSYAFTQKPKEHLLLMNKYSLKSDSFSGLIMPDDFRNEYESNAELRYRINENFMKIKETYLSYIDESIRLNEIGIYILKLNNTGDIIRLVKKNENNEIELRYFFIPGNTVDEKNNSILSLMDNNAVSEKEKKVLGSFIDISKAEQNL